MAQKISSLPGLAGTTVSLGRIISNWEYEWIVTFPHAYLDVPLLELNKASVGRSAVYTKTTRLQKGFGIDGVKVAVEVSSNGQDFSSSGNVYHYTPTPDVYSLEPNHGPVQGGTEVVVTGINFQNSSSLRCKFGERVTAAATFLNSTQFTCVSPSGFNEGDVYVEITNHGLFGASIFTSSRKVFTYDAELKIDSVFPSLGPTIGNFSVQITGGPFRKTDVVRCKFAEIVVVANWKSYDEVLCIAPPHSPGVFTLELTRNGQDYTDTLVPLRTTRSKESAPFHPLLVQHMQLELALMSTERSW
ncbi:Immunoglobulin E-set [Phytophthora cactorum]|nr:Immunoglobulin E-set [Phytophthora cactorum]